MKKLLQILALSLFLITPSQADDIRDFEIEGTSVGSSLTDYFNDSEIKNGIVKDTVYSSDKFIIANVYPSNYEVYESLQFHFKKKSNYKIHSISGANFVDNMDVCYDLMNEIDKELSIIFKNAHREDKGKRKHRGDPTGNSYITSIYYYLEDDSGVRVACFDWSVKLTEEKNWRDHIKVSIFTKEILDWFANEAYK